MKIKPLNSKIDILALNRISVLDENNTKILVSSFWKNNPVVIVFLRHFGCIACRAHVDQIWKNKKKFDQTKTNIIFVGNGSPNMIKLFKEDLGLLDAPIFTDPTLEIFDACGFNRGLNFLLTPMSAVKMAKLYWEGYSQGKQSKETGAHTQMGGIAVFKPPGLLTYHFVSAYLGDFDDSSKWSTE